MNISQIIELISTILTLIGVPLIAHPKIHGLYVLVFGQIGWTMFAILNDKWFFCFQSIFLLILNIVGIQNWKKKKVGI